MGAGSVMECSAQDDFQGVLLESTPVERTGRKQEQAEGEVELGAGLTPDLAKPMEDSGARMALQRCFALHGHDQTFLFLIKESVI